LPVNKELLQRRLFQITILVFLLSGTCLNGYSQYKIRGTVYDSTRNYPLELVSVLTTSGRGTITNKLGQYEVEVNEKDSIWFSYLNKPTVKFPVLKIANPFGFDISLQVNVPELKEVKIRPRNYREDSAQNRKDYARVFDFRKGYHFNTVTPTYGAAAGFDLNEIINAFRFRRNRQILSFQKRLLQQEQDKFVEHRFNKALVRRLTGLTEPALDSFMLVFRPPYFFAVGAGDYDFQKFIKDSFERYKKGQGPMQMFIEEEEQP
jgi:hypothetical protein